MDDSRTTSARLWTSIAGWIYVTSGLVLVLAAHWTGVLQLLDRLVVPEASLPDRTLRLYAGVAGGLTTGLGAIIVGLARARSFGAAARAVAVGIGTWFTVDTTASLSVGSWQNAVGNVLFVVLGLPAVWALATAARQEQLSVES